ncbi:MAG: hypothetical protein AAF617_11120 [Bacteroidota bacterium]
MVSTTKVYPLIFSTVHQDGRYWSEFEKIISNVLYSNRDDESQNLEKLLSLFVKYIRVHLELTENCFEKIVAVNQCFSDLYSTDLLRPETVDFLLRTRQKCEPITQLVEVSFQIANLRKKCLLELEIRWKTSWSGLRTQIRRVYLDQYTQTNNIVVD